MGLGRRTSMGNRGAAPRCGARRLRVLALVLLLLVAALTDSTHSPCGLSVLTFASADATVASSSSSSSSSIGKGEFANVTTSPGLSIIGLTVDVHVANVFPDVVVQVWEGAHACGSPDTAVVVTSARVLSADGSAAPPYSSADWLNVTLNIPSVSATLEHYSVCAANLATASGARAPLAPQRLSRQRQLAVQAVSANFAVARWTYVEVGQLQMLTVTRTPSAWAVDVVPATFAVGLALPSGGGSLEQLCTDATSCATALTPAEAATATASDVEYLLSVLRQSLFYVNSLPRATLCPPPSDVLGRADDYPQAVLSVAAPPNAAAGKWLVTAQLPQLDAVARALSADSSAEEWHGAAAPENATSLGLPFMACVGPTVVIAPSAKDGAAQGHVTTGAVQFYARASESRGSSTASSSSSSPAGSSSASSSAGRASSESGSQSPDLVHTVYPTTLVKGQPQVLYSQALPAGLLHGAMRDRTKTAAAAAGAGVARALVRSTQEIPAAAAAQRGAAATPRAAVTVVAALASDIRCSDLLTDIVPVVSGQCTVTAPRCASASSAYYCEGTLSVASPSSSTSSGNTSRDGGSSSSSSSSSVATASSLSLEARGVLQLLSLYDCATGQSVNVRPVVFAAATPMIASGSSSSSGSVLADDSLGVTAGFAGTHFLSFDRACGEHRADPAYLRTMRSITQYGYVPAEETAAARADGTSSSSVTTYLNASVSRAEFYVCLVSPDGTLNFTTPTPTVTVEGFTLRPRALTAGVQTVAQLLPRTLAPWRTYLTSIDCASSAGVLPSLDNLPAELTAHGPLSDSSDAFKYTDSEYTALAGGIVVVGGAALGSGALASVMIPVAAGTNEPASEDSNSSSAPNTTLGVYHVCSPQQTLPSSADSTSDGTVAFAYASVQSLLVVSAPSLRFFTARVAGAALCAAVSVPDDLYSMVPGVDATAEAYATVRPYFASEERGMYLLQTNASELAAARADHRDLCAAGPSAGGALSPMESAVAYATASNDTGDDSANVCFNTTGLQVGHTYIVCAGTPDGFQHRQPAAETAVLSAPDVQPTQAVSNVSVEIHLPQYPNTTFILSSHGCVASASTPRFTTDASGNGELVARDPVTQMPLAEGNYWLCFQVEQLTTGMEWQPLLQDAFLVVAAPVYAASPSVLVAGTKTVVQLGEGLLSSYLLPLVYTDAACSQAAALPSANDTAVGASWSAAESSNQVVMLTSLPASWTVSPSSSLLYLCATDPLNGSLIAFAAAAATSSSSSSSSSAGFRVIAQTMLLPTMEVSTCAQANAYFVTSDGTDNLDVNLVDGPCCVDSSRVIQEGTVLGVGYRSFLLNDSTLAEYDGKQEFTLCVQEATPDGDSSASSSSSASARGADGGDGFVRGLCYTPGNITFFTSRPSQCSFPNSSGVLPILALPSRMNVLGQLVPARLFDGSNGSSAYTWTGLIVLAAVCGAASLVVLVTMAVCGARAPLTRALMSRAEEEKAAEAAGLTVSGYRAMLASRGKSVAALALSSDRPPTDECPAALVRALLQLSPEDIAARISLRLDRDVQTPKLVRARRQQVSLSPLPATSASDEVAGLVPGEKDVKSPIDSVQSEVDVHIATEPQRRRDNICTPGTSSEGSATGEAAVRELVEVERRLRRHLLEREDEELLHLLETERRVWRRAVSSEGQHLRSLLTDDPFWAARREALALVNERALQAAIDGEGTWTATQMSDLDESEGEDQPTVGCLSAREQPRSEAAAAVAAMDRGDPAHAQPGPSVLGNFLSTIQRLSPFRRDNTPRDDDNDDDAQWRPCVDRASTSSTADAPAETSPTIPESMTEFSAPSEHRDTNRHGLLLPPPLPTSPKPTSSPLPPLLPGADYDAENLFSPASVVQRSSSLSQPSLDDERTASMSARGATGAEDRDPLAMHRGRDAGGAAPRQRSPTRELSWSPPSPRP